MPAFEKWKSKTENSQTWELKYYKGLGTSTSKEVIEYFSDMKRHRIQLNYNSERDDFAIQLAFSKKFCHERKNWLTMTNFKNMSDMSDLYEKDTTLISCDDFINKEYVLFLNLTNERAIPSLVDGFTSGQRRVMFTCFKCNLHREIDVAQLAASVSDMSAYRHGEMSLKDTIVNLAQNYVGSNNINLLQPIGQFGTRLHGGENSASAHYTFTALSPLARLIFNPKDDPLFNYLNEDGLKVEPNWYCPIIPTVLVNGAEGTGVGWSTKVLNYNPRDIIMNIKKMIKNEEPLPLMPHYKNFKGTIKRTNNKSVMTSGEIALIGDNSIEITELPIGCWTQNYKESVLQVMLDGQEPCIADYFEYHTDTTVKFVVKMAPEQLKEATKVGLRNFFKLQKTLSTNLMVLFDENGCIKRYESPTAILKEFFTLRLKYYEKRKNYLEGALLAESLKLDNIARFIMEKIEGKIKVENLKKAEIVQVLRKATYDPDPINKWKKRILRELGYTIDENNNNEDEEGEDFDYILSNFWTTEKKDEILKQQKQKGEELKMLREKSKETLW